MLADWRIAFLVLAALFVASLPSSAPSAVAKPSPLSASDEALVVAATAYLQSLTSAKAHFIQTDARGAVSRGEFYIQRPGKARFAYDPPSGLVIASNGVVVSVLDTRLKTFQRYPLGFTPLSLFLSREIRLDRGVIVTSVTPTEEGFSIVARDSRRRSEGRITLFFSHAPVSLTGWTTTDAQGASIRVRLTDLAPAGRLDPRLFTLQPTAPEGDGLP